MIDISTIPGLEKIILGIVLAAPIGPVSVEMIRRGLNNGALAAFTVRIGAAVGNTLCLLGAFFGLSQIASYPWVFNSLGLLGASFLLYTGIRTTFNSSPSLPLSTGTMTSNGLWSGFYLSIANPVAIVFWSGIYAASAVNATEISIANFLVNMLIIVGVLLWGAALASVISFARSYLNEKSIVLIGRTSGILMIYFGCKYLISISQSVLQLFF